MSRSTYTDASEEDDDIVDEEVDQYDELLPGDGSAPSASAAALAMAHQGVRRYEPVTDSDDAYSEDWDEDRGETPRTHHLHHNQTPRTPTPAGPSFTTRFFQQLAMQQLMHAQAPPPAGSEATAQAPPYITSPMIASPQQQQQQQQQQPGAAGATGNAPPPHDADEDDDGRTMDGGDHYDDEYEPTEAEMLDYCEWLGVDPVADRPLMWIVREALRAPLPESWRLCYTEDRELYYFNMQTGESIWDHPMDAFYKALYKQEKAKLMKKRQCMRQYPGSYEIKPLQIFFSELADEEGVSDEDAPVATPRPGTIRLPKAAPWAKIPEALIDAIDFRLYIDPIVLPSGRTVSRHTIINNRWRDPFSREYVENRRLVPNVDKRGEIDAWLGRAVAYFFDSVELTPAGMERAVSILPYLLDKEEEMCLRGQQRFFELLKKTVTVRVPSAIKQQPASQANKLGTSTVTSKGALNQSTTDSKSKKSTAPSDKKNGTFGRGATGTSKVIPPSDGSDQQQHERAVPPKVITGVDLLADLTETKLSVVFNCLLTMSTSTSRECLLFVLSAKPNLALHPALRGFSDDVLHMLHVSPADLSQHAQVLATAVSKQVEQSVGPIDASAFRPPQQFDAPWTNHIWTTAVVEGTPSTPRLPGSTGIGLAPGANTNADAPPAFTEPSGPTTSAAAKTSNLAALLASPISAGRLDFRTTNTEIIAALKWVATLTSRGDVPVNPLHRLDFIALLHVVFSMEVTADVKATPNTLARALRGGNGWPEKLCACPEDVLVRLFNIGLRDESVASRLRTLFDVAWFGGERALETLRADDACQLVTQSLLDAGALMARERADDVADMSQSADHLGAILVYHSIIAMDSLSQHPLLALRVAYNLLPRLTRSQWKPKHFDATVTRIIDLIVTHPVVAWRAMKSSGSLFLIRELCKKKRNVDDSRVKLAQLEAAERRLEQSNAINNWGLLTSRLLYRALEKVKERTNMGKGGKAAGDQHSATTLAEPSAPSSGRVKLPSVPGAMARPSPRDHKAPTQPAQSKAGNGNPPPPPPRGAESVAARIDARMNQHSAVSARCTTKRDELHAERATGIVQCLQTLLAMRLKPKAASRVEVVRNLGSLKGATGTSDEFGDPTPVPPSGSLSHRRVSTGAMPIAQSRREQMVASSCPALPPINLQQSAVL